MTTILIVVKTACENYSAIVKQAQDIIVSYFGTKHATADDEMPIVKINDIEVNNTDVGIIDNAISVSCDLLVVANSDSPQVRGKFIFLTKE